METKDLPTLRDLVVNGTIDAEYYLRCRTAMYSGEGSMPDLEEFAVDAQGSEDAVRRATFADLTGDRDAALELLKNDSGNPWAAYWRGYMLLEQGRTADALEALEASYSQYPEQQELRPLLVEARAMAGDIDGARELQSSLGLNLEESLGAYLEALILERNGDYSTAIETYERAVEGDDVNPRFNFRLGYLAALHGDDERAVQAYEACIARPPVFARAAINLGILYEDLERYENAIRCYEMILYAYPEHPRAKMYLADAEASLDMYYDREKEKEKSRRKQLLQIPVTDFELSVRSRNCLAKMSIHTLGDLVQKTEAELLSYKNFGETSLAEIKKILAQKGFRLGQGLEDKPRASVVSDPEKSSLLGEPVSVLELSSRAQRCMDRLGIETLSDLVKRTELELINQRNFGVTSLNEVKRKLKERGLALASG